MVVVVFFSYSQSGIEFSFKTVEIDFHFYLWDKNKSNGGKDLKILKESWS